MDAKNLPLQLEELFFPLQEVRANPEHNPADERFGTNVDQMLHIHEIDVAEGRFGISLELNSNEETSVNPPYFFRLHAYAIVTVSPQIDPATQQSILQTNGQLILVGAARERLLDLTSRAPWGRFLLNTQPVTVVKPG